MRKLFVPIVAILSFCSASAAVTFEYDESTKTLTFSGEGEMDVYTTDVFGDTYIDPEWRYLREDVEKVIVNEGVTDVGEQAFMSFENLKEVKLASTVEAIGEAAFEECESLSDILLPEGLKTIGKEAFYNCKSLTSFSIPKNVTELPDYAFRGCSALKSIDLGNVSLLGKNVFAYCGFESFEIPKNIKVISECMFFSCGQLKTIDIPEWVEEIGDGAFYYCKLDTINFLGETFPAVTGYNNFTMEGNTVICINCSAYNQESIDAIESHGGAYNTTIIPALPKGSKVYSTDNTMGPLVITPVDCDKKLYKLTVDLWPSYQVTWEGSYNVPADDLHSSEIIVDMSEPATIIANLEYVDTDVSLIIFADNDMGNVDKKTLNVTPTGSTYKLVATPNEGYQFLYWDAFDYDVLTEEQKTSDTITITIDSDCMLIAVFGVKVSDGVDYVGADNIVVTTSNARISVNRDEFRIYDILGHDVTNANGSLSAGVYLVKCEGKCFKTVLK